MTEIKVENLVDVMLAEAGELSAEEVRSVTLEGLVDTGATLLCLPNAAIEALGLSLLSRKEARTANGTVIRAVYQGARLTVLDRSCTIDVMELPDEVGALVGYVPLENLDLVADPKAQQVIPNPAHGGKWVYDLY